MTPFGIFCTLFGLWCTVTDPTYDARASGTTSGLTCEGQVSQCCADHTCWIERGTRCHVFVEEREIPVCRPSYQPPGR